MADADAMSWHRALPLIRPRTSCSVSGRSPKSLRYLPALLLLLASLSGCARAVDPLAERVATIMVDGAAILGAKVAQLSVKTYEINGERIAGHLITFNRRPILISQAEPKLMARAAAMLNKHLVGETSLLSMLDSTADRPIVSRIEAGWPKGQLDGGLYDEAALSSYMALHRGQRVVAFGHIEGGGPADARFVAYGVRDSQQVPIRGLLALARDNRVQLTVLGCRSFKAGAPAGPLYDINGADLPAILQAMRVATTYGEALAAMGNDHGPIIVDPQSFAAGVAASVRAYRIAGVQRAVAYQIEQAPTNAAGDQIDSDAPPSGEYPASVRIAFATVTAVLLGTFGLFYGMIVPAGQIARWRRLREADAAAETSIERLIIAVDGRLRLRDDTRKALRIMSIPALPFFAVFAFSGFAERAAPRAFVASLVLVVALNIAAWSADRAVGRGQS